MSTQYSTEILSFVASWEPWFQEATDKGLVADDGRLLKAFYLVEVDTSSWEDCWDSVHHLFLFNLSEAEELCAEKNSQLNPGSDWVQHWAFKRVCPRPILKAKGGRYLHREF